MNVKRAWLISDTHWGMRGHSKEWLQIVEDYFHNFFIPLVKKEYKEGDILIHCGDVFDSRQMISLFVQHSCIKIFEELNKIFPEIHIIVGNHDIAAKNTNEITSVDCLKYMPNVNVYKDTKVMNFSGKKVILMPWRRDKEHELETLEKYPSGDYVFCHSEVAGVQMSRNVSSKVEHANSVDIWKGYKKVYSGHIHFTQQKKNFTLVGNPYEMTRSDAFNRKGIYVVNFENDTDIFYENTYSPKFLKYNLNSILEMKTGDIIDKFSNNFIDLYVSDNAITKYNISALLHILDGKARKVEVSIYENEKDIDISKVEMTDDYKNFNLLSISKKYIDSSEYDEKMKERLIKSVQELYNKINNTI